MAVLLYGFPPGVGATGTAALLNVPQSLEALLSELQAQGCVYVGGWGHVRVSVYPSVETCVYICVCIHPHLLAICQCI